MSAPLTVGLTEASQQLGLSHWTLRKFIRERRIRAVRIGRRVLLEPSELERLVKQGREGAQGNVECAGLPKINQKGHGPSR
jgi:excisionase family DNA binding protein